MNISKLALILFFITPLQSLAQKTATLIYIDQYKDIAISEMKRTGIPASITLAQGIIESNSGESNLALNFKNHFGIKCKSDWKGETTYQDDDAKQECFRVYPNANTSFKDHSDFLKSRTNYAPLFELDPVDDSAWAYGLKKAGYATASDYPRKLLKVINDFELSQFNFPELALNDDNDTPVKKIDTLAKTKDSIVKENIIFKDSLGKNQINISANDTIPSKDSSAKVLPVNVNVDSINSKYLDTIKLSSVKGIVNSDSTKNTAPNAINGIGALKIEVTKDSSRNSKDSSLTKKDTSSLLTNKPATSASSQYPKGKFKANQILAVWATAGSSFLAIANANKIALYKLYLYNDLVETELVAKDQILYLAPKKKEISNKIHLVAANETFYDISQNEAIQLSYLQAYNPLVTDKTLTAGSTLVLFKPNETPKLSSTPVIVPITKPAKKVIPAVAPAPEVNSKNALQKDTTLKNTTPKEGTIKKPLDFIKKLSLPSIFKRKKNN